MFYQILTKIELNNSADTNNGSMSRPKSDKRATKIVLTKKTVAFNNDNRIINSPKNVNIFIY